MFTSVPSPRGSSQQLTGSNAYLLDHHCQRRSTERLRILNARPNSDRSLAFLVVSNRESFRMPGRGQSFCG